MTPDNSSGGPCSSSHQCLPSPHTYSPPLFPGQPVDSRAVGYTHPRISVPAEIQEIQERYRRSRVCRGHRVVCLAGYMWGPEPEATPYFRPGANLGSELESREWQRGTEDPPEKEVWRSGGVVSPAQHPPQVPKIGALGTAGQAFARFHQTLWQELM